LIICNVLNGEKEVCYWSWLLGWYLTSDSVLFLGASYALRTQSFIYRRITANSLVLASIMVPEMGQVCDIGFAINISTCAAHREKSGDLTNTEKNPRFQTEKRHIVKLVCINNGEMV
jgi:hypothetical protein